MINKFNCPCGTNNPNDAKYYDGVLGYEAFVCKKCARTHDFSGVHPADDWSKRFVNLTNNNLELSTK